MHCCICRHINASCVNTLQQNVHCRCALWYWNVLRKFLLTYRTNVLSNQRAIGPSAYREGKIYFIEITGRRVIRPTGMFIAPTDWRIIGPLDQRLSDQRAVGPCIDHLTDGPSHQRVAGLKRRPRLCNIYKT